MPNQQSGATGVQTPCQTVDEIPLCYSCVRYATIPDVNDCPELSKLGQRRSKKVKKCEAYREKAKVMK